MENENDRISQGNVQTYPFPHILIDNYFPKAQWAEIVKELTLIESTTPDHDFESPFGVKREWRNFEKSFGKVAGMIDEVFSDDFIVKLKLAFQIPSEIILSPDRTFDGGGYVVSPPGSYLGYHADFNFSSKANAYRVINVLIYANGNYSESFGGKLHLLDNESKTVEKSVSPLGNTLIAFLTDDLAFHGVSRNNANFYRRSFNLYYYANAPISANQTQFPHRTIWLDIDNHQH